MARPHPMSPLSAAVLLGVWVQYHGRLPTDRECAASNGLVHWVTIYKLFPGSSFSARVSAALALPGVLASNIKLRDCLGTECTVRFFTTPETRLCPRCRSAVGQRASTYDEPLLRRASLRQWGVGRADWNMELMAEE